MKRIRSYVSIYHVLFWIYCFVSTVILALTNKFEFHRKINSYCSQTWDTIFSFITYLGDGIFIVIISLLIFIINMKNGLLTLIAFILSGSMTQILKKNVFSEYKRPYFYFKDERSFHKIEGFNYHIDFSFPSGHATSIFALTTMIYFLYGKDKYIQILLFSLAVAISFSRVCLSQHFLVDIVVGSIIGYVISWATYLYLDSKLLKLNRSLFRN